MGKYCVIDPTAIIRGPTTIGDKITVNAGSGNENCTIGSNVHISQDCQFRLPIVGNAAFLAFRAALFMSEIMENSMGAQNIACIVCDGA